MMTQRKRQKNWYEEIQEDVQRDSKDVKDCNQCFE